VSLEKGRECAEAQGEGEGEGKGDFNFGVSIKRKFNHGNQDLLN